MKIKIDLKTKVYHNYITIMRTVPDHVAFREKVRANLESRLHEISGAASKALNLEKGIYNFTIRESTERSVIKKWDNPYFVNLYIQKWRSVSNNLSSPSIISALTQKTIRAHEIAFMTHQEMDPDRWSDLIEEKKIRDANKYAPKLEASTDNFTCGKCKSKKCTYYQLQTRSADEPMTCFVTCLECGASWKC